MGRSSLGIIVFFLTLILLLAGCPNLSQDTDPVLGEFDSLSPDDDLYDDQWNLNLKDFTFMEEAWGVLHSDEVQEMLSSDELPRDVVVAVLDTEIDTTHPELDGVLVDGYDAIEDDGITVSSSALESQQDYDKDHGTHVAGILGAATNNEAEIAGIAGVGWLPPNSKVRIMPVTVLDSDGTGSLENIRDGLLYAAGMHSTEEPERPADVINLSLGFDGTSAQVAEVLDKIKAAGITVVAAAGNEGCDTSIFFPASHSSTIAVGSADPPDNNGSDITRSFYSNCGDQLDIMAPGGSGEEDDDFFGVLSLAHSDGTNNYMSMAGTSMAAPHVAGVTALLYAISNDMNPAAARQILTETAELITHAGNSLPNEEYGWGLLHAERAVRRALMDPYGPYRNDGSVTVHEPWPFSPQRTTESETVATEKPPEGTYATDRAALVLERDWYETTPSAGRRDRLNEIADAHGLLEIRDRGHRFPTAYLPDGEDISLELLEDLRAEAEIHAADFSVYFYRQ